MFLKKYVALELNLEINRFQWFYCFTIIGNITTYRKFLLRPLQENQQSQPFYSLIITNYSTIKSKETVYFHWASINDLCYSCLHCRNLFSFHNIARCSPKPGFQVEIWYTNRPVRLLLEELGTNVLPSSNTIP